MINLSIIQNDFIVKDTNHLQRLLEDRMLKYFYSSLTGPSKYNSLTMEYDSEEKIFIADTDKYWGKDRYSKEELEKSIIGEEIREGIFYCESCINIRIYEDYIKGSYILEKAYLDYEEIEIPNLEKLINIENIFDHISKDESRYILSKELKQELRLIFNKHMIDSYGERF